MRNLKSAIFINTLYIESVWTRLVLSQNILRVETSYTSGHPIFVYVVSILDSSTNLHSSFTSFFICFENIEEAYAMKHIY